MPIGFLNTGHRLSAAALVCLVLFAALVGGCGDNGIQAGPGEDTVQGLWEGKLRLSTPSDSTLQVSSLRLELVQRDFTFDGYLLRTDPLAGGFGLAAVDTFLVAGGAVSTRFVSFQSLGLTGGNPAVFEGVLSGGSMAGTVVGSGFSGTWDAKFLQ